MKTTCLSLIILLTLFSCYSQKISNSKVGQCNENLEFKKYFFEKIDTIEKLVLKNQNVAFWHALGFVSKYATVSYEDTLNYARTYPYGTFLKDKKNWLKWYEKKNVTTFNSNSRLRIPVMLSNSRYLKQSK